MQIFTRITQFFAAHAALSQARQAAARCGTRRGRPDLGCRATRDPVDCTSARMIHLTNDDLGQPLETLYSLLKEILFFSG
jgi:hypothetical protein